MRKLFFSVTDFDIWKTESFGSEKHALLQMGRAKRICYLSPMRAAKVQASLRIRAVSPEPSLLAHTNSESRGTFRQKARSLAPLNGWACAVEICHDGMLEDTNSLDGAQINLLKSQNFDEDMLVKADNLHNSIQMKKMNKIRKIRRHLKPF